jgi:hypothetical protein
MHATRRPGPTGARSARLGRPALVQLGLALALVGAVGLLAIGASGLLAAGMGAAFGKGFVAGDQPGVTYTPARCADFREYHPEAASCEAAATAHHFDEVVGDRVAAGVLGLLLLGAVCLAGPRLRRGAAPALPAGFAATVGASLSGVAAAGLLLLGLGAWAFGGGSGAGQYLSAGLAALLAFAGFAVALLRALRAGAG